MIMVYIYDGSFEGLLTCIFYGYSNLNRLEDIRTEDFEINILDEEVYITTEVDKAERIVKYVKSEFGYEFFRYMYYVYLSNISGKEFTMLKTIFSGRDLGKAIVHSTLEPIVDFMKMKSAVERERHAYTGLLRFTELSDSTLYGQFEPEHDILPIVFNHFKKRLGDRPFLIHDVGRKKIGYFEGELVIVDDNGLNFESIEDEYSQLWKVFHKAVAIENRINEKLQMGNLPKKYWKYLTEMN